MDIVQNLTVIMVWRIVLPACRMGRVWGVRRGTCCRIRVAHRRVWLRRVRVAVLLTTAFSVQQATPRNVAYVHHRTTSTTTFVSVASKTVSHANKLPSPATPAPLPSSHPSKPAVASPPHHGITSAQSQIATNA